jgi:phage FluMu gp28-like protein
MDRSPVKVSVKSRRIGITWATAYEAVEVAATAEQHGGSDFWYQTYAEPDAREFIEDVGKWALALEAGYTCEEEELSESEAHEYFILPEGEKSIKIQSVRFKSGFRVTALPHSPRKLRGKDGVYCLDEAAYHDDLGGVLKAVQAFRMWGGRVIIISTQAEEGNAFNQLVDDIKNGKKNYSLHVTTLVDAVGEGLYKRICMVARREWSQDEEDEFVSELLSTEGAQQEFMCVPGRAGGQFLPYPLIEKCMDASLPVLRWDMTDAFMLADETYRKKTAEEWCIANLLPHLNKLDKNLPGFYGQDFGRVSDLTSMAPGQLLENLKLRVPFMVELRNIPFDQQEQVMFYILSRLPRRSFCAVDATGNGSTIGEHLVQRYTENGAEACKMTVPWYAENMPPMRARFEDSSIIIPKDVDVRQDLGMLELINGVPQLPTVKNRAIRPDAPKHEKRHGDAAIALATLCYAARHSAVGFKSHKVEKRGGKYAGKGMF